MSNAVYKKLQEENAKPYDKELAVLKEKLESGYYDVDPYGISYGIAEVGPKRSSLYKEDEQGNIIDYWGNSMWDNTVATPGEHLGNTRANNQPWIAQLGAGIGKGVLLAATTFIDGTVGLLTGLGTGIYNTLDDDPNTGFLQGLWDNEVSKVMHAVNEWSEKVMPNYYTQDELENPLALRNLFSVNTLADKLIKNLGFSVGAVYSGGLFTKALSVTKLPQLLSKISPRLSSATGAFLGGVYSAVGEANHEALAGADDYYKTNKEYLDAQHLTNLQALESSKGTEIYETLVFNENKAYNESLKRLEQDRIKVGNANMLANTALLSASNIFTFGKFLARGFNTSKKGFNAAVKNDLYTTNRSKAKGIALGAAVPFVEGSEELAQKTISNITALHYTKDVNNFYQAKLNGEAEQETVNWINSFSEGIAQTVSDSSSWEEFLLGAVTGAMGIPTFRSFRKADGSLQSPIKLVGGSREKYKDYMEQMRQEQEITDYMNKRMQSPEFMNYYQGLIRHNKYQKDMDAALENNDVFNFKTAEHAQLISDIIMFDRAGKLNDLISTIDNFYNTSDSNLNILAELYNKNRSSEDKIDLDIPSSKDAFIKQLNKDKEGLHESIENYKQIKEGIDIQLGDRINEEQLSELTYIQSQINDWIERRDTLVTQVKQIINRFKGGIDPNSSLNSLLQSKSNKEFVENLQGNNLKELLDAVKSNSEAFNMIDIARIVLFIRDSVLINQGINTYNAKLKEYLENPNKLQEDLEQSTENVATEETKKKSNSLKDKLTSSTNLSEFKQTLNEEENDAIKEEVLKSLEEEGNPLVKNYKEINIYNTEVQKAINSFDEDPDIKINALKLLQDQFENSSTLKEIANPNSIYVDNAEALYDDNLSIEENNKRFQEAQYTLLRAMNQVNNDNKFKDEFSQDYKELKEKGTPNPNAPTKDTTGDSGTSTIPSVNEGEFPSTTSEFLIGDITVNQINDENKQLNDRVETPDTLDAKQKGKRPYYRPSIPELHIQASKEGDFRPFNEIVAEREKGVNFDDIYNYLRDKGAFTYVNEGNLKVGDEIKFMIDPAFEEKVADKSWHTKPTIFMIDAKNNQVVGSLDESDYSIDRYEGLKNLEEKIRQEYSQIEDKTKEFIATPITKVSQIMVGKIPYGNEERTLSSNMFSESEAPIFGIIKNGVLVTNNKPENDKIISPVRTDHKEGRMYLLIRNAAGKYSPAAVRVKHFNRNEFNPEDITVQGTKVFENIQKSITALAKSFNEEELNNAVKLLKQYLYIGDLHIDWFTSNTGNGIRFTKVQKDAQGKEIYEDKNGQRVRKEIVKTVFLTEKWDQNTLFSITGSNSIQEGPALKNTEEVSKEITNILLDFNLPIQVNLGMLNNTGYNKLLLDSGVLTSNITEAKVKGSWFTTDYFNIDGNLKKATNPVSLAPDIKKEKSPVGGNEGVEKGTQISVGGVTYYVDLTNNTITDINGNKRNLLPTDNLLIDLTWAQNNFGNATQSSIMVDNKIVTPSGRVLDRSNQKYLNAEEAQKIKDKIAGRERNAINVNKVISQIEENQRKVDKNKTDENYYYILEEDGKYHEYERVHSKLGDNWIASEKQIEALNSIRTTLSKLADNVTKYNEYLTYLSEHYKVDLDEYIGKTDAKNRNNIVFVIKDEMSGTKSLRAVEAGTSIDNIIRNFFTSTDTPVRPDNISEKAFIDLFTSLTEIKSNIEARGERFLTNNIVLFQKYPDGTRIAGEVDILSVDANGNFKIYDVKTKRFSFYPFIDGQGNTVDYFRTKPSTKRMSDYDYYTLQLSAYKNLFESQYNTPITTLAILPFVLTYDKKIVNTILKEKGIIIPYNPTVNVPLISTIKTTSDIANNTALPVFNSTNETLNPVNNVLPEFNLENSEVGYFIRDGKLHKGYLSHLGQVNNTDVYITKVPNISSGFGRPGEQPHVASNSYYAVFPNGNTIMLIKNDPLTMSEQQAKDAILNKLKGNSQKVLDMSSEKTLIFDTSITSTVQTTKSETASTILNSSPNTGAFKTAIAEKAINEHDDEFEDDLDLDRLRKTDIERPLWNQEQELAWIKKVLPQLSDNDRIKIVKGLIRVAESGAYAWGQFSNGIITLSDIAAEGTVYHEAFHAVFLSLLDPIERVGILEEAERKFGKKNAIALEEDLAEEFREFIMQGGKDTRNLGTKILDFFKSLLIKVFNWKYFVPSSMYYYTAINKGHYSNKALSLRESINRARSEEYTKEMQQIKDKAIADGTFMKAPNGKPTNLNERQWIHVRTKAFKDWFGDWEKIAENIVNENKFREALQQFENSNSTIDRRSIALSNLKPNEKTDEQILLDAGYKKVDNFFISPDFDKNILSIIPVELLNIMEKAGIKILSFGQGDYLAMAGGIRINGHSIGEIKFTRDNTKERIAHNILHEIGHYIFSHYLRDNDKNKALTYNNSISFYVENLIQGTLTSGASIGEENFVEGFATYFHNKIFGNRSLNNNIESHLVNLYRNLYKQFGINNSNISKVVDENGEPLVVYHGSPNKFTEFNINKFSENTDDGYYGKGFYFSRYENIAKIYGDTTEFFLNIRNPYTTNPNILGWEESERRGEIIEYFGRSKDTPYHEELSKYDGVIQLLFKDGKELEQGELVVSNPNQIKSATDNIGEYSNYNNDTRYSRINIEELNNALQKEYDNAKKIVKELNNRKYLTEEEARMAFKNSGISSELFYRITRQGANNAVGYKIQILTKDNFKAYKNAILKEQEFYNRKAYEKEMPSVTWDRVDADTQMMLIDKGWTKEQFDSISQMERDSIIKCASM